MEASGSLTCPVCTEIDIREDFDLKLGTMAVD